MEYQLAAIGELLIDFVQENPAKGRSPRYTANPGGAPGNVCTMFSKLGGKASFIGKIGKDAFGALLKKTLTASGVGTEGLIVDPQANTSLAFVSLDESGERSFIFYRKHSADTLLRAQEIPPSCWNKAKILHFGSVSLSDEPSRSATLETVKTAREKGLLISYDPNYRKLLWDDPGRAREILWQGAELSDIVKVSDEEMRFLTGETLPQKGAAAFRKSGAEIILITLGNRGAYYCIGKHEGLVDGVVVNCVDSTGAGDAFVGAFLYSIIHLGRGELKRLEESQIRSIIQFSNAAAALATTKYGAIPAMPSLAEIEAVIGGRTAV